MISLYQLIGLGSSGIYSSCCSPMKFPSGKCETGGDTSVLAKVVAAETAGDGSGVGVSSDGRWAGNSCAALVIVFFMGSKADSGITLLSREWIPVFWNTDWIVVGLSAMLQAL